MKKDISDNNNCCNSSNDSTPTRLAGDDRYHTSVMVAVTFFGAPTAAVLAYAQNFPDGLCAGPLAAAMDAPLLLTSINKEARAIAYATALEIGDGYVLGGPTLISDKGVKDIFSMSAGDEIKLG